MTVSGKLKSRLDNIPSETCGWHHRRYEDVFFCKITVIKAYIIHLNGAIIQDVVCFMGSLFDLESSTFFSQTVMWYWFCQISCSEMFFLSLKYSATCLYKLNTFMHFSRSKDMGTTWRGYPDLRQVWYREGCRTFWLGLITDLPLTVKC